MKTLTLKRVGNYPWGTPGVLTGDNFLCTTMERPWEDNKPDISRFPDGEYACKRLISPRFGETFEITGVDGRFALLFHRGNWPTDSKGCVILGTGYAFISNLWAVSNSGTAFSDFIKYLAGENEFKLIVKSV